MYHSFHKNINFDLKKEFEYKDIKIYIFQHC